MDLNLKGRLQSPRAARTGPGARSRWHLSARARRSRSITRAPGDAAKAVVGESEAEGVWAITCGARTSLISTSFKREGMPVRSQFVPRRGRATPIRRN